MNWIHNTFPAMRKRGIHALFCFALLLTLCLSSCTPAAPETPEEALGHIVSALHDYSTDSLATYVGGVPLREYIASQDNIITENDMALLLFEHIAIQFQGGAVTGDTASIQVKITNRDLSQPMAAFVNRAIDFHINEAFKSTETRLSKEESDSWLKGMLGEQLEADEVTMRESVVTIAMNFVDEHWQWQLDVPSIDAMLGSYVSLLPNLRNTLR